MSEALRAFSTSGRLSVRYAILSFFSTKTCSFATVVLLRLFDTRPPPAPGGAAVRHSAIPGEQCGCPCEIERHRRTRTRRTPVSRDGQTRGSLPHLDPTRRELNILPAKELPRREGTRGASRRQQKKSLAAGREPNLHRLVGDPLENPRGAAAPGRSRTAAFRVPGLLQNIMKRNRIGIICALAAVLVAGLPADWSAVLHVGSPAGRRPPRVVAAARRRASPRTGPAAGAVSIPPAGPVRRHEDRARTRLRQTATKRRHRVRRLRQSFLLPPRDGDPVARDFPANAGPRVSPEGARGAQGLLQLSSRLPRRRPGSTRRTIVVPRFRRRPRTSRTRRSTLSSLSTC